MKSHLLLVACGTTATVLLGSSILAIPPTPPPTTPRPNPPAVRPAPPDRAPTPRPTASAIDYKQALKPLEGNWTVTVRSFAVGDPASSAAPREIRGTSQRTWILNGSILEETVRTQAEPGLAGAEDDSPAPGRGPSQDPSRRAAPTDYEGRGLFGFDERIGRFVHIWADSHGANIERNLGSYDESSKSFTFTAFDLPRPNGDRPMRGRERPGMSPPGEPGTGRPGTEPPSLPDRPGGAEDGSAFIGYQDPRDPTARPAPPTAPTPRPGARPEPAPGQLPGQDPARRGAAAARVVIRIVSEREHVVEYYSPGPTGASEKIMEITYTR